MKIKLCLFFISLLFFPYTSYSSDNFNIKENHYKVLGVSETASSEEIKSAWRKMAMQHHPDRMSRQSPEEKIKIADEKMAEINEARDVLLDPQQRIKYDRDLKEQRRKARYQAKDSGDTTTEHSEESRETYNRARDFYYSGHFRGSPNSKPFFTPPQQVNIRPIPNTEKVLHLFYLILANDLHFKEAFRGSVSDWKSIKKTKKISETALKEILRTMGISNMNKQSFQRILSDFYHNFSEEILRDLLKESPNYRSSESSRQETLESQRQELSTEQEKALHRRNILAQAFLQFITEVKEWYEVQNLRPYERRAIEIFHTLSFLNQNPSELRRSEDRYIELLQKRGGSFLFRRNPLTKAEKKELRAFEKQIKQDIQIFRNVLAALGLPKDIHNDMLLRSYLEGLKDSLVSGQATEENSQQRSSGTRISTFTNSGQSVSLAPANSEGQRGLAPRNTVSFFESSKQRRGYPSSHSTYIKDKEVIRVIRDIKITLDDSYYQNLKAISPVFSKAFLKRFPPQFILLHTAFGAAIYREALTDSITYGAEKNPDMMSHMMEHSITPSAIISLVIFMAVSQQVHYRLYGGGRLMDGKTLKTPFGNISSNGKLARSMSPSVGLGAGYFAYVVFSDLLNDQNLNQCVKNQFQSEKQHNRQQHVDACDAFLLTWWESEKWKHYSVDIATIMGSAWLAHKLINRIALALQPLNLGGLLFRSGKFIALRTYAGMAVQIGVTLYTFVEFHKALEEWVGKPLKEQLTAGALKNSIQDFSLHLEKEIFHLESLNVISNQEAKSKGLEDLATEAKEQVAKLGYKFKKWAEVRGLYYNQSVQLWNKQLNKLTLPYSGTLKLLKDIFLSSHLKYGFELVEKLNPGWDSEEELNNNKDTWNQLNSESITFSFSSFAKMPESQKEIYCQATENNDFFTGWNALCEKDFQNANNFSLIYETAFLILQVMDDFSNPHTDQAKNSQVLSEEDKEDFKLYIGRGFDEMFSSQPNHLIQNLSGEKRFQLSKNLIRAGLDWTNSLSYFHNIERDRWRAEACNLWYPTHTTDDDIAEIYNLCLKTPAQSESYCSAQKKPGEPDLEEEYNKCMGFFNFTEALLSQKISAKLLRTGIYLLKEDILKPLIHVHDIFYTKPYEELKRSSHHYFQLLSLSKLLEAYKKGEQYFVQAEKLLEALKDTMDSNSFKEMKQQISLGSDPHLLSYNLLCKNQKENEEQHLTTPQFFSRSDLSIYDFSSKQFIDIQSACKGLDRYYFLSREKQKRIHQMLFQRPAKMSQKRYENLYLALEDILRQSYSSSKNVEENFQRLSQNQLDEMGGRLSENLNGLTESYYKDLINRDNEISSHSSLEEFDSYYHKQRIFFDIRSFTGGGIRGMEISLFQIHYWLNTLKQLLQKGETLYFTKKTAEGEEVQTSFNKEQLWMENPFDEKAFEQMRWETLSLLQSYHNTYKKTQGPYLLIPDGDFIEKLNTLFYEAGKEGLEEEYQEENSRFVILQKRYPSSLPVFMPSDVILSHILEFSIPNWNNPGQIRNLNSNPGIEKSSLGKFDLFCCF